MSGKFRHLTANSTLALVLTALAVLTPFPCRAYNLTGHIEPAAIVSISLHGATSPFETSTVTAADGSFRFARLASGTYTLIVSTAARGSALQTVELTPGTVDAKGRLDLVLKLDPERLEADGGHATGATISATVLTLPVKATKEYDEAQRCLSRRDSACAVSRLKSAVALASRFTAAWNQLGTIAYQTGNYADAEGYFRKALDADPDAFEPLVNLGGVLLNLGRFGEGLDYNRRAVTRRPNDALANSQLGLSYFGQGDLTRAEEFLKTAVRLDPAHFSHPQLTLAELYQRRGDHQAALEQLRDFLARHPDSPQASGVRERIVQLSR